MKQTKLPTNRWLRLMQGLWLCGLLGFAPAHPVLAQCPPPFQGPTYENDAIVVVTCPPQIFATNFVNNSVFTLNLSTPTFFETWDTLNYTNNGSMATDYGFRFDTQSSSTYARSMAGNFYNPGTISCASLAGTMLLLQAGQFIVNATNISMPGGTVNVGMGGSTAGGLISFTGQNVDLSDSTLTLEGNGLVGGGLGLVQAVPNIPTALIYYAGFGLDTNQDWNPGIDLTASSALPSWVRMGTTAPAYWTYPPGFPSYPAFTTPYVSVVQLATNDIVYRCVFVENTVPNVTANVYISSIGLDYAVVEFVGSYTDPVTGLPANNYLYLQNDYALGAKNPVINALNHEIPSNFFFRPSSTALFPGIPPDAPGFLPFPNGVITNSYSYVDVQCLPTTVPTNSPSQNVSNYLAILPGRIQINASSSLDLSRAQISGQNFISVTAPNQLNGSVGTAISSAYSDINVGVTNGNLMATNLLEPSVPAWNGTVQAWSTRWFNLTTNTIIIPPVGTNTVWTTNSWTVTNDYNVVIVANQAAPTTPTEVWNMALHGTNSIVISDTYNILNNLYLDCVSLTLTTNGPGAQSPYGELNLQSASFGSPLVYNVWSNSVPNLLYLTNNGVILLQNIGDFGGPPPANYVALVNHGLISDQGSQMWADNFESSGALLNGVGSFTLHSLTATLTNGSLTAGADVSITTGSLLTGNLALEADRSLTLTATDQLADTGVTNGSVWTVGLSSVGKGISVPIKPPGGGSAYGNSLLGTTINLFAPSNRTVVNVWAGTDYGVSTAGFTNNLAVGRLILDSIGAISKFTFNGTGTSNAIYVDRLELLGHSDWNSRNGNINIPSLLFNTNLVIYYADAVSDGTDVSVKLNGFNTNHLRWVPAYAGYFSSTNLVFAGVTNAFNVALAESTVIDSNGNGIANAFDPTPFFLSSEINLKVYPTNHPANTIVISWNTIPLATNTVFYSTNLMSPITWTVLTNFISPQPYPGPATNVMVFDPMVGPGRFYQVTVYPWLTYPY